MTDRQKQRLAKLARDYQPLCAGDIDAKRCAAVIIPILRDAILETQLVGKTDAARLAREFAHAAAFQVAAAHSLRFEPYMRR
ncbi:MAG: hypothetical protein IJJ20_03420 [Thermoguttaceae bacterium]|nr:hypothetical protein [Thermoguttaceae bacterium]